MTIQKSKIVGAQLFRIHAALHDESSSGWIWGLIPGLRARTLIEIKNVENGKSIVCEYRSIDGFFISTYNQNKAKDVRSLKVDENPLVISYWYRAALGIEAIGSHETLMVAPIRNRYARIRAGLEHPDYMSRLATRLGLLSMWLGFVSVLLGLLSVLSFYRGYVFLIGSILTIFSMLISGFVLGRLLKWGWPITPNE